MSVFEDILMGADPAWLRGQQAHVERFLEEAKAHGAEVEHMSWVHHLRDITKALMLATTDPYSSDTTGFFEHDWIGERAA